jgi:hypothetical protein
MLNLAVDLWIKEVLAKVIVFLFVVVLVNGIYQSMAQEPHTCEACTQLYKEVTQ